MKFTLTWLKDYLDTQADLAAILDAMTMAGLEVEEAHDPKEALKQFTVCRIVSAKQHPNADKLQVCQVETVDGTLEIVCGGLNARPGLVTAFAPIGAFIPGSGITLAAKPVRGVVSNVASDGALSQLAAEVRDLKQGFGALEEQARSELGMIAGNETYYQVVPASAVPAPAPPATGDAVARTASR